MLEARDTDYYNVAGIQINDPSINEGDTMTEGLLIQGASTLSLELTIRNSSCNLAIE